MASLSITCCLFDFNSPLANWKHAPPSSRPKVSQRFQIVWKLDAEIPILNGPLREQIVAIPTFEDFIHVVKVKHRDGNSMPNVPFPSASSEVLPRHRSYKCGFHVRTKFKLGHPGYLLEASRFCSVPTHHLLCSIGQRSHHLLSRVRHQICVPSLRAHFSLGAGIVPSHNFLSGLGGLELCH